MGVSEEYLSYVLDQLAELGALESRRMFGGVGLYRDRIMFALIADDVLYLKVDDSNRADFERAEMGPFRPFPDKSTVMSYYEVPVDVLESRDRLARWSRKALAAAHRKARN